MKAKVWALIAAGVFLTSLIGPASATVLYGLDNPNNRLYMIDTESLGTPNLLAR